MVLKAWADWVFPLRSYVAGNAAVFLLSDVTQRPRIGASKLALTGEASFAFPIHLSRQTLTLPSHQKMSNFCVRAKHQLL